MYNDFSTNYPGLLITCGGKNLGIVEIGSDCTVDDKDHTHLTYYNFRGRVWAVVAFSMY